MKYLFTVLLQDGTYIEQTPEDKSVIDPYKSAYYDVLEAEKKGNKPLVFVLMGPGSDFLVDLRDGRFEINGAPIFLHDHSPAFGEYRLIYYRNRKKIFTQGYVEIGDETTYHFGWQNTVNGENIQHVMRIS
jgi:hypothetical protein